MENKVLARVNGNEITEEHKNNLLRSLGPQRAQQFQGKEGDELLVKELINQELFYFDALDSKLEDSAEFKAEMENARVNILKQINIHNLLNTVKLEDEELKEFFNNNKEKYNKPATVAAKHILVSEEEKINEIAEELKGELSFEEAAQKYSTCPSKERGGDLGTFGKGQMVPEFEKVAFELEINEISEPVKTQFGYHIIMTTEKNEGEESAFEEVKDHIAQELVVRKQNDVYLAKVEQLKENYEVEILN
ncbi:peptidylprolyl isomerase [Clostridiaceae bacterium HSG29]|nr:peptidylprolyl isomerase [Clostridiaceae bacterium HSG29]